MRSWNGKNSSSYVIKDKCSQFTNEELKLIADKETLKAIEGSQFTNEELKPIQHFRTLPSVIKFAIYQWGVETRFILLHSFNFNAFAIYQWGVETFWDWEKHSSKQKFAIYQWGVETRNLEHTITTWFTVRNLPMRSWNSNFIIKSIRSSSCSQFTNEELKKNSHILIILTQKEVRNLPMRSWNIDKLTPPTPHCPGSQFTNEELKHISL